MLLSNNSFKVYAMEGDYINTIESIFEVNIDKNSVINLYDSNNNIVAFYYKLLPIGYIIIDSKTFGVIEYSVTENNKYIVDNNKIYYYSGPLEYYQSSSKSDNYINDCKSNERIAKNDLQFESRTKLETLINKGISSTNNDLDKSLTTISATSTTSLPYATKPYDTNTGAICGATASAILIEYYYSHIDSTVALSANITSDGQILTNLLVNYVPASADVIQLDSGLDLYLNSLTMCSKSAGHVTLANIITSPTTKMELCIMDSKPCIIGLTQHPTYGEHWVVATGFQKNVEYVNINDGWGNRGVLVAYSYVDSCVYLK